MQPDRYAVLGNPVAHSKSPFIHARFAEQTGQAIDYGRVLCPLDGFVPAVNQFVAEGGRGCNITVPFKLQAPALATQVSERAALAGAANVLRFDAGGWSADNTDGVGLIRDIQQGAGFSLAGRSVLLVGAGGAGAGVLGPLLQARPQRVVLANRTRTTAETLAQRHTGLAQANGCELSASGLDDAGTGFQLLINASASSLQGAGSPVATSTLAPGALVVDLMYGPAAEPFLTWAREHGAHTRDGLGMLVEQAAEAFLFWRGVRPETAPVLRALRAELAKG
jgi:shikimate dehydrogenase